MLPYFSKDELKDILIATFVLGVAFAYGSFNGILGLLTGTVIMTIILFFSFIPHELAHKYVAIKYGYYARYVKWDWGLLLTLLMSLLTHGRFLIAVNGAVMIYQTAAKPISSEENAKISMAGPLTNMAFAIIFLLLSSIVKAGAIHTIFYYIAFINAILAVFNLLPIPPLDGSKIFWYSIPLWLVIFLSSVGIYHFVSVL